MKKLRVFLLLIIASLFIVGCGSTDNNNNNNEGEANQVDDKASDIETIAENFLTMFVEGKYEDAVELFDETMAAQLPAEGVQQTAEMLSQQLGKFIDFEYKETTKVEGYDVVLFNGTYEATDVVFTVSFNADKEIAGFFIQ